MLKEEAIKRLEVIANASQNAVYDYTVKANDWEKYGKSRTYFSIVETRKDGASKHYSEKKYGFLDNITGEYKPEKYGDMTKDYTFGGMKF